MRETIDILGVPVDVVTMEQARQNISSMVASPGFHTVITPNPEIVMLATEDARMMQAIQHADMVVPDGIGVVIASRLVGDTVLPERVPGYDLVQETMREAVHKGYKYYFLGSKPGVSRLAKENMEAAYPGIQIVGEHDGYFKEDEIPAILEDITASGANILLVALGAPKQEIWIETYKDKLPLVKVAIGVGGALDVMSGTVKRAPLIFQKMGLEWFYRLVSQPTRFKRMLVLPKFMFKVVKDREK
jgi:N-acetylglucosaminyldiphosphoundecaprenol N-acetyl-beta-D-mannosaminyltransferase